MKILAARVPAACNWACKECCSPDHHRGNPNEVFEAIVRNLDDCDLVYMTSRGMTGDYARYPEIVHIVQGRGVSFCPLGATKNMILPGMPWAEISIHYGKERTARKAIEEAHKLGVATIAALVWDGIDVDLEQIANDYGTDGVLFRALREGGSSTFAGGTSAYWCRPGADLHGWKPIEAYPGLEGLGGYKPFRCIDSFGEEVPLFIDDGPTPPSVSAA